MLVNRYTAPTRQNILAQQHNDTFSQNCMMFALALISAQFRISKLIFSFVSLYALLQETNTSIWTDVGWENFNASMKMAVQSIHSYDCEAMKARFKDVHAMTAQFSCQLAYLSCHRLTTSLGNLKSSMPLVCLEQ